MLSAVVLFIKLVVFATEPMEGPHLPFPPSQLVQSVLLPLLVANSEQPLPVSSLVLKQCWIAATLFRSAFGGAAALQALVRSSAFFVALRLPWPCIVPSEACWNGGLRSWALFASLPPTHQVAQAGHVTFLFFAVNAGVWDVCFTFVPQSCSV